MLKQTERDRDRESEDQFNSLNAEIQVSKTEATFGINTKSSILLT